MRQTNWRLVIVGGVLIILALGFFLFMLGLAPQSNDPKTMLETVGQVCGAVGGIAIAMIVAGLIGRKV
jgi:TRAP-type mannitol/chloroaromatic compound transport system permease large subunit